MNVRDIIDLAKSGYKVSEIKELLALGNDEAAPAEPSGTPDPDPEPEPADPAPEPAPEPEPAEPASDDDDGIDYKARYQELLEKNRKDSLSRDVSGKGGVKTPEEIVKEAFRNIM